MSKGRDWMGREWLGDRLAEGNLQQDMCTEAVNWDPMELRLAHVLDNIGELCSCLISINDDSSLLQGCWNDKWNKICTTLRLGHLEKT